jgi:glycyl-tRNA synthetase
VLSIADKLDNLIGCYSIGLKPTSSSDPYALRRQAMGIVKILISHQRSANLKAILEESCKFFPKLQHNEREKSGLVSDILNFITARSKSVFEDFGFKKDEIDASLQTLCWDPYDQFCKVQALHAFRKSGTEFGKLFEVYKRAKGQLQHPSSTPFNLVLAREKAEIELVRALDEVDKKWRETIADRDYVQAFRLMAKLQAPLAKLFDTVKILADDPKLQQNRIALLQKVFAHFEELLDFRHIQEGS